MGYVIDHELSLARLNEKGLGHAMGVGWIDLICAFADIDWIECAAMRSSSSKLANFHPKQAPKRMR